MVVDKFSCFALLQYDQVCFLEQKKSIKLLGGKAEGYEITSANLDGLMESRKIDAAFLNASAACIAREVKEESRLKLDAHQHTRMTQIYFEEDRHLFHVRHYTLTDMQHHQIDAYSKGLSPETEIVRMNEKYLLQNSLDLQSRVSKKHMTAIQLMYNVNDIQQHELYIQKQPELIAAPVADLQ